MIDCVISVCSESREEVRFSEPLLFVEKKICYFRVMKLIRSFFPKLMNIRQLASDLPTFETNLINQTKYLILGNLNMVKYRFIYFDFFLGLVSVVTLILHGF